MRWKQFLTVFMGILATVVVALILGGNAWGQVTFKTLHKFWDKGTIDGYPHAPALILDAAGYLYGTTATGGAHGYGRIYQLTPNSDGTWTEQVLHDFNMNDGADPRGNLTFDGEGNLYGTTAYGGGSSGCYFTGDCGVAFKLTHNSGGSWSESVLHVFTGENGDGSNTDGALIFDGAGNLYGTSEWGGGGWGAVFELTPNSDGSWTEHTLFGFDMGSDGGYPWADTLVFDAAGNLYGATAYGGMSGCSPRGNGCYGLGVIFQLTLNSDGTWSEKVLHSFTAGKDGATPTGPLVLDASGNLYGTTFWGGAHNGNGNVYKLTPNPNGTWTEHVLHQFTGGRDGGAPFSGLSFDAAGNLYGATTQGGKYGYGVVFKLTPTSTGGWSYQALHSFRDTSGAYPEAAPIFDAAGNLYGTTNGDGTTTFGTVYEITP